MKYNDIELPNGMIVQGVPEGTSMSQLKQKLIATGDYTEDDFISKSEPKELTTDEALNQALLNPATKPAGTSSYVSPPGFAEAATAESIANNARVEEIRQNDRKRAMFDVARNTTPMEALGVSAINEVSALGSGMAELGDKYLPSSWSNFLSMGDKTPEQRRSARKEQMASDREMQEILDTAHPVTSTVGKGLPYILTDIAMTPAANAVLKEAGMGLKALGKGITDKTLPFERGLAANSKLRPLTEGLNTSILGAMKATTLDPVRAAMYKELATSPLKGAVEGGANYNDTAAGGALSSVLGQGAGSFGLIRNLGKPENILDASSAEALKNAMRQGYRATPGMRTGDTILQTMEQGMASEPHFRDLMKQMDVSNDAAKANMVAESMGITNRADSATFSPKELKGHMDNLKATYEDLESKTKGKFGLVEMGNVQAIVDKNAPTYRDNRNTWEINRWEKLNNAKEELIQGMSSPVRNPLTGRMETRIYDGAKYKDMRQKLTNRIKESTMGAEPDFELKKALTEMRDQLDASMEKSMGPKVKQEWKDANEKYAMTKLVMKKGLNPLGKVDASKLSEYLMSKPEVERTLMGQGNRIKNLQDVIKIHQLEKDQFGKLGWSGSGIWNDVKKTSLAGRLLNLPFYTNVPFAKRAGFRAYMSGYPSVTGVLPGLSRQNITRMSRAQEQGNDTYRGGIEATAEGMAKMSNAFDQLLGAIKSR